MSALRDTKERFYPELANDVFVDASHSVFALIHLPIFLTQLRPFGRAGVDWDGKSLPQD